MVIPILHRTFQIFPLHGLNYLELWIFPFFNRSLEALRSQKKAPNSGLRSFRAVLQWLCAIILLLHVFTRLLSGHIWRWSFPAVFAIRSRIRQGFQRIIQPYGLVTALRSVFLIHALSRMLSPFSPLVLHFVSLFNLRSYMPMSGVPFFELCKIFVSME